MDVDTASLVTTWRIVAGPESAGQFVSLRRATVGAWTADTGGRMRHGDVAVVYGTDPLQSYVAIARVCGDPVQNDKVHHLRKRREWWVYLQIQPLALPLRRDRVEAHPWTRPKGSGLKTPVGPRAHRVDPLAAEGLTDLIADLDQHSAERLAAWRAGRGRYPTAVLDPEELRYATWAGRQTRPQRELILRDKILTRLTKGSRYRPLTWEELGRAATKRPTPATECPIVDAFGRTGAIDIALVDNAARKPTVLIIEVKLHARLAPNPVPQVLRYQAALAAQMPNHTIRPAIVAGSFADPVLTQAERHGIITRRVGESSGRLSTGI